MGRNKDMYDPRRTSFMVCWFLSVPQDPLMPEIPATFHSAAKEWTTTCCTAIGPTFVRSERRAVQGSGERDRP